MARCCEKNLNRTPVKVISGSSRTGTRGMLDSATGAIGDASSGIAACSTGLTPLVGAVPLIMEKYVKEIDGILADLGIQSSIPGADSQSPTDEILSLRRKLLLKYFGTDVEFFMSADYDFTDGLRKLGKKG